MANYKKLLVLAVLYSIIYFSAYSQADEYKFKRIDNTNGLSNNQVRCILQDKRGFIWFGTMSGLNRYDGTTFKIFRHDINDTFSINDNFIISLLEDDAGKIWIKTRNGYNIYDTRTDRFERNIAAYLKSRSFPEITVENIFRDELGNTWYQGNTYGILLYNAKTDKEVIISHNENDSLTIRSNFISSALEDRNGNLWVVDQNGMIQQLDGSSYRIKNKYTYLFDLYGHENHFYQLVLDKNDYLWVYITDYPKGIFYLKEPYTEIYSINSKSETYKLNNDAVSGLIEDNEGNIWIGTDHGGINILNKKKSTIKYLTNNQFDDKSLSQNSITTLYKDNKDIIWAGTFKKGINCYHKGIYKFRLIQHIESDPKSIGFSDVDCFAEDKEGNLWIGTNGGGLFYFDRVNNTFTNYKKESGNPNSLSDNVVVSLCIDRENILWIGTYFGGLNSYDGKNFRHFRHEPSDFKSISDDRIWAIYEDSRNNLWIGTLGGGLDLFNRTKNEFYHYRNNDVNSVRSDYVSSILEDKNNNLWFGTADGIDILNRQTGRFIHLNHEDRNATSLSNNNIHIIVDDNQGKIWIGTRDGLNLYDETTQKFRIFRTEQGLPDNTILSILVDGNGNLWIGTTNGLSNLVIKKDKITGDNIYTFINYDQSDGLQGKEFNEKSAFKTRKGELIFGGGNGINIFNPDEFKSDDLLATVIFTNLQIFNRNIKINEKINGRIILTHSLSYSDEIVLKYKENHFSIEFTALSYLHPEKIKFEYLLEGFNNEWLNADKQLRKATFTNLDPGKYIFRVRASNIAGIWNPGESKIAIRILPPFWKSYWAIIIYTILIIGILTFWRRMMIYRTRMKFSLIREREEAKRLHDLDMMKIKLFTNISHELRTPISLILSPIEKLLQNTKDKEQKHLFQLMHRNSKRLLNLVNQLLDFRRMEVQEFKLNPVWGDIIKFIKDISYSFSDLSDKKNIHFAFKSEISEFHTSFDPDKLEKILFNLLANAFKFTLSPGIISVEVGLRNIPPENKSAKWVEILIKDTGIGIPTEKQDKIFEQFFQSDSTGQIINPGSGIGLALTKEFVRLHGGNISVESEPGKGSSFKVLLPVTEIAEQIIGTEKIEEEISPHESIELEANENYEHIKHTNKKPSLLLIEDNDDFRFYLKDNLQSRFSVTEAGNGKEGWHQTLSLIPDLVVCDVIMPEMDGIEYCKKLKSDKRTSHIPLILLSAKTTEEQKLEAFKCGTDDYITKPFSFEILESRIKNLIIQRESLKKAFKTLIEIKPSDISITSLDEKLIQKALDLVEKNIGNPNFSVEELSRELGMSRVHLYKKLLSLTGKTPIEFIRNIRLKRAAQLLEKSQLTVSEIAYQVGFNNPYYFTKYFKAEYNILPSEYASKG